MYYIKWIEDDTYLISIEDGYAMWGCIERGKGFISNTEAEEYLNNPYGPNGRSWSPDQASIVYMHPLNIR